MKIEVSKNMLAGAMVALGKLVSRMSPVDEYKSVLIVLENGILHFIRAVWQRRWNSRLTVRWREHFV